MHPRLGTSVLDGWSSHPALALNKETHRSPKFFSIEANLGATLLTKNTLDAWRFREGLAAEHWLEEFLF